MNFDEQLFPLLNRLWTHPWLDVAMPLVTDQKPWLPFLAILWIWLLLGRNGAWRRLAILLVLIIIGSDQVSSTLIKPLVQRKRPCCAEPNVRLLVPCKTSKSFPSSHAANTAGVAGVVWLEAGWKCGLPVWILAVVVGFSRIYVGVHYPSDVICGHLLGLLLALLLVRTVNRWFPKSEPKSEPPTRVEKTGETMLQNAMQPAKGNGAPGGG